MIKLIELNRLSCKYIEGDALGAETEYCGRECVPSTSWCIKHLRIVVPKAETIIKRELVKWEKLLSGEKPEVRLAGKMTEEESLQEDDDVTEELV